MAKQTLKITSVAVKQPQLETAAAATTTAPLQLSLTVENPGTQPLYVWASWRAYDYDAASHVLTVYLTGDPPPPPGITLISDHPRTPAQVVVTPKGKLTLKVELPATIRRRVPSAGLGLNFVEEPIGKIERVDSHIQFATEAFETKAHETPEQHRTRMLAQGEVVRATLTTTEQKE
jgi:hypothetical protein